MMEEAIFPYRNTECMCSAIASQASIQFFCRQESSIAFAADFCTRNLWW